MSKKRSKPVPAPDGASETRPAGMDNRQGHRLESVTAGSLSPNPMNWRTHPPEQAAAFQAALKAVGWTAPLIFNETSGKLIDGHLRQKSVPPETVIPVVFVQLSPEQERIALATHDPLAAMAGTDIAALEALLEGTTLDGDLGAIADELDALIADAGESVQDDPAAASERDDANDADPSLGDSGDTSGGGGGRGVELKPSYQVTVDCAGEAEQQRVYELLKRRGFKSRVTTMYGAGERGRSTRGKR